MPERDDLGWVRLGAVGEGFPHSPILYAVKCVRQPLVFSWYMKTAASQNRRAQRATDTRAAIPAAQERRVGAQGVDIGWLIALCPHVAPEAPVATIKNVRTDTPLLRCSLDISWTFTLTPSHITY